MSFFTLGEIEMYAGIGGSWTDESTAPSVAQVISGELWLDSDGANPAIAQQVITINQVGVLHVLKFDVVHGPLNVRIGTATGTSNILDWQVLRTGTHQLEFTPTAATVYLQFFHTANAGRVVDNVSILPGAGYSLPYPYTIDEMSEVHYKQIEDVLYLTHRDHEPRRLERRGHYSWSLTKLRPNDGPFGSTNTGTIAVRTSRTSGEATMTADGDLFTSADVGVLFYISGAGQSVSSAATSADTYTQGIKVSGINASERTFTFSITGTFVGKARLQRSSGNENNYVDYGTTYEYTTPITATHYDAQDNQTWYYRLAVKPGDYTSGTISMSLTYAGGSSSGVVRVLGVASARSAIVEIITNIPNTNPTKSWKRGAWNSIAGWPSTVTAGFGRLWFASGLRVYGSKSDDFTSFAEGTETDKAITARLGAQSSEAIRWIGFTTHLVIGTKQQEYIGLANTTNDPVGPSNFQILQSTFDGGSEKMPAAAPGSILFVHRNGRKLIQFVQDPKALSEANYTTVDLNRLSPDLLWDGIRRVVIQQEPERRMYVLLDSGVCQVLLFRREEEVIAWHTIETNGFIEDVNVVQQEDVDRVYFIVRRTVIGGAEKRFLETLGPETVLDDEDHYHLDGALSYELERPAARLTLSASSGTVMVTTDADAFSIGDVNSKLWVNVDGALIQATITAYASARSVTASVNWSHNAGDIDPETIVSPAGRWGLNPEVTQLSAPSYYNGTTLRLFGDMQDLGTAVVSGGIVTLPQACSTVRAGVSYKSRWKSLKLSYGAQKGTALVMPKAVKSLGLALYRTGPTLQHGHSFDRLRAINTRSTEVYGAPTALFTGEKFEAFDARYAPDSRLFLEVDGPHPATVGGLVPILDERDR